MIVINVVPINNVRLNQRLDTKLRCKATFTCIIFMFFLLKEYHGR